MKRLADPGCSVPLHKEKRAQRAKAQPAMDYDAIDPYTKRNQVRIVTAKGTVVLDETELTNARGFIEDASLDPDPD